MRLLFNNEKNKIVSDLIRRPVRSTLSFKSILNSSLKAFEVLLSTKKGSLSMCILVGVVIVMGILVPYRIANASFDIVNWTYNYKSHEDSRSLSTVAICDHSATQEYTYDVTGNFRMDLINAIGDYVLQNEALYCRPWTVNDECLRAYPNEDCRTETSTYSDHDPENCESFERWHYVKLAGGSITWVDECQLTEPQMECGLTGTPFNTTTDEANGEMKYEFSCDGGYFNGIEVKSRKASIKSMSEPDPSTFLLNKVKPWIPSHATTTLTGPNSCTGQYRWTTDFMYWHIPVNLKCGSEVTLKFSDGNGLIEADWLRISGGCYEAANEICRNGIDDNCNGLVDEEDCVEQCDDQVKSSSTVNVSSSNLRHSQTLYRSSNSQLPIEMTLTYNNLDRESPVGWGWSHSYNIKLIYNSANDIYILKRSYGKTKTLLKSGDIWKPAKSEYPQLGADMVLKYKDGMEYHFDANGDLIKIQDRYGNFLNFENQANTITITDSSQWNRAMTIVDTDSDGLIDEITDPNGNTHSFSYLNGMLMTITTPNPDTPSQPMVWEFTYENEVMKTKKAPGNENPSEYFYNVLNRVIQVNDPDGNSQFFDYDLPQYYDYNQASGITTVTEKDDGIWIYEYDPGMDRLTAETDPYGNRTEYQYDFYSDGKQWKKRKILPADPDHPEWTIADRTYETEYYPNGNIKSEKDPLSNITSYTYNATFENRIESIIGPAPDNLTTSYSYEDNDSNKTIDIMTETAPSGAQTKTYYLSDGRIDRVINDLGQITKFDYYDYEFDTDLQEYVNRKVVSVYLDPALYPDTPSSTTTYKYDKSGNLRSYEDTDGNVTEYKYNSLNQLQTKTDPLSHSTSISYDLNGNIDKVTDANLNVTDYDYNYEKKITQIIQDSGTDNLNLTTDYIYGGTGECTSCNDGGTNLIVTIDANGEWWTNTYYYTGKKESETDPLGNVTEFTYNPRGLMTSLTTIDVNDNPLATEAFDYDQRGLLDTEIDPLTKMTDYQYDANGRLEYVVDRNGDKITYDYIYTPADPDNPHGRTVTKTYYDHTDINTPVGTVVMKYDRLERIKQIEEAAGTTTYYYYDPNAVPTSYPECMANDPDLMRMMAVTDANGFTVCYKYDEAGNLSELTYPDGKTVIYDYDELNRLKIVTIEWLNKTAEYSYDPAGRLELLQNFNDTKTSYEYDDANRLTDLVNYRNNDPHDVIASYSFVLDNVGNRKSSEQLEPLPSALADESTQYFYNDTKTHLDHIGGTQLTYDNEGQLITDQKGDSLFFDYDHRLKEIIGIESAQFTYNALGHRIKAVRGVEDTYYIYDIRGNVIAEASAPNISSITKYYIHGAELLAMVLPATPDDDIYVCHYNAIGSTVAITDDSSAPVVVNKYAYTPLGELMGTPDELFHQPFKYVGKYGVMHEPNGIYYMRARYYDPEVGRFISEDPIGFDGGTVNLYEYVKNNPINFSDPSGLKVSICGGKVRDYYHQYVCVDGSCAGLMPDETCEGGGRIESESYNPIHCEAYQLEGKCCDEDKFESCVQRIAISRVGQCNYYGPDSYNCISWRNTVIATCKAEACQD